MPNQLAKGKRRYTVVLRKDKVDELKQLQCDVGLKGSLSVVFDAELDRIIENYRKGVKNESKGI